MVPQTRRRFLHVATAAVTALAGCDTLTGGSARSSRSSSGGEDAPPASGSEADPPMVRLRADSDVPPIRLTNPGETETDSPPPSAYPSREQYEVIDTRDRADRLRVAADGDAERVSSFASETDFDTETLYLETRRVEECFRLRLCQISWGPTEIETDYVRPLRPYDERCRDGAKVFESRLIRLPVALDAESVRSYGTSVGGRSRCSVSGGPRAEGEAGSNGSAARRRAPDGGDR